MKNYLFSICFVVFSTNGLRAQWVQTPGPEGGDITALAITRSAVLAGADGTGIYRSSDSGTTWTLADPNQRQVSLFLSVGDTVLSLGSNLYRSIDGGNSWSPIVFFPDTGYFCGMTQSGGDLFITHIASLGGLSSTSSNSIVYRSTDDGLHWDSISSIPEGGNWTVSNGLAYMATLADVSGTLLLASDSTIYRSTDRGVTWKESGNGFPSGTSVISFAVNGQNVATSTDAGVFLSTNGGLSWQMQPGVPTSIVDLGACIWAGSDLLIGNYNGVYRKSAGAWNIVDSTPGIAAFAGGGNSLFAGSVVAGIIHSSTQGSSWKKNNSGIVASGTFGFSSFGTSVLVSSTAGLFRSTDEGETWSDVELAGAPPLDPNSWDILASYGTTALDAHNSQMYRTRDAGETWAHVASPMPAAMLIEGVALSGNLALSFLIDSSYFGYLFISTDQGDTWHSDSIPQLGSHPTYNIVAILGDTIFLTSGAMLARSWDNGVTWNLGNLPLKNGYVFDVFQVGSTIFLSGNGDLISSSDGGNNWQAVSESGIPNTASPSFSSNGDLFASFDSTVFLSRDQGKDWSSFGTGLSSAQLTGNFTISGNYILAGTWSHGVWRRPLRDLSVENMVASPVSLNIQASPNPCDDFTSVSYAIPQVASVSIQLFDALGRSVRTVEDGWEPAGSHTLELDTRNLSDGTYFCRIATESASAITCIVKNQE